MNAKVLAVAQGFFPGLRASRSFFLTVLASIATLAIAACSPISNVKSSSNGDNVVPNAQLRHADNTSSLFAKSYASPWPQWPNAPVNITISSTKADSSAYQKANNAEAHAFYNTLTANEKFYCEDGSGGGLLIGWDCQSGTINLTDASIGLPTYIAKSTDPVWVVNCLTNNNSHSKYCNGLKIHIPSGARTENSGGGSCDCHIAIIQPAGYTPVGGSYTMPTLSVGYAYEFDFEDATNNNGGCSDNRSADTTFGKSGGTIYSCGTAVMSTQSTGFTGDSAIYNDNFHGLSGGVYGGGYVPTTNQSAPYPPASGFGGAAIHGAFANSLLAVTAEDLLQGVINHPLGLGVNCLQNSDTDEWPGYDPISTDTNCSVWGTQYENYGWHYDSWTYLDTSGYQAVVAGTPTAQGGTCSSGCVYNGIQLLVAKAWHTHGAIPSDTGGTTNEATFTLRMAYKSYPTGTDPASVNNDWDVRVPSKFGLSKDGSGNWILNAGLPTSLIDSHVWEIKTCVVQGTC